MNIQDSVALVTGANRGLGKVFVDVLLKAGAKKVYAAARDPSQIAAHERVVPVKLDVTNHADIERVARDYQDVNLLINNAGVALGGSLLSPATLKTARTEWETLVLGPLALSQAFAPALARNGGGAVLNILSALSWISLPGIGTYSAAKSAAWSLTNGLRHELSAQGTLVSGLHVAFIDTDMSSGFNGPKTSPEDVARIALEGVARGDAEIIVDPISQSLKQGLTAGVYLTPPTGG